mmetsp:Transcript_15619/g.20644  ORF Transcript_15619/g.20644 Transcript_15619/m.20644 type:complete len:145 (-) Transcript_15619:18-452(-)
MQEEESDTNAPTAVGTFAQKYGWPFVIVYMAISAVIFGLIYTALLWGVDIRFLLDKLGISSKVAQQTSLFFLALGITKLLFPIKLPLAGIITYGILKRNKPDPIPQSEKSGLLDQPPPGDHLLDEEFGIEEDGFDIIGPTNTQL